MKTKLSSKLTTISKKISTKWQLATKWISKSKTTKTLTLKCLLTSNRKLTTKRIINDNIVDYYDVHHKATKSSKLTTKFAKKLSTYLTSQLSKKLTKNASPSADTTLRAILNKKFKYLVRILRTNLARKPTTNLNRKSAATSAKRLRINLVKKLRKLTKYPTTKKPIKKSFQMSVTSLNSFSPFMRHAATKKKVKSALIKMTAARNTKRKRYKKLKKLTKSNKNHQSKYNGGAEPMAKLKRKKNYKWKRPLTEKTTKKNNKKFKKN
ncbi:hypothetical protein CHUAL_003024 [Chamberlinius hualienensis]